MRQIAASWNSTVSTVSKLLWVTVVMSAITKVKSVSRIDSIYGLPV